MTKLMRTTAKLLAAVLTAATIVGMMPVNTYAAAKVPVGFVQTETGMVWQYTDGSVLKNNWLEMNGLKWHFDKNGNMQTGLVTVGKKTYCLYANGLYATSWQQIGDGIYYFNSDGSMVKNKTVNGFKLGADGKVVFTAEQLAQTAAAASATAATSTTTAATSTETAVLSQGVTNQALANTVMSILSQIITPGMTDDQKLLACYNYVIDTTSYKRTYETPAGDFTGQYAMDIFTTHQGNCYRYASAFAYLAKGCGFDVNVTTGMIRSARGGVTPHGWAIVNIGGVPYIFDPDMADAKPVYRTSMFKTTYENYPVKPLNAMAVHAVHF